MVLGSAEWLVANINMTGFYRVNYDPENWERLLAKLSSKHQVQHLQYLCNISEWRQLISCFIIGCSGYSFDQSCSDYWWCLQSCKVRLYFLQNIAAKFLKKFKKEGEEEENNCAAWPICELFSEQSSWTQLWLWGQPSSSLKKLSTCPGRRLFRIWITSSTCFSAVKSMDPCRLVENKCVTNKWVRMLFLKLHREQENEFLELWRLSSAQH